MIGGTGPAAQSLQATRQKTETVVVGIYQRLTTGSWPDDWPTDIPDADWDHAGKYLAGCGFAGALAQPGIIAELAAAAPSHFIKSIQRRAIGDALREICHVDALAHLHTALLECGTTAILLKGAALYLLEKSHARQPARIPGDIDIWIPSSAAAASFRQYLLRQGFAGDSGAPRTAPHHLAPVTWRNSAIEIHTAFMPPFWGVPDAELARRAIPMPDYPAFFTLNATHMVLHEAIHSTSHLWNFGLKLPFDISRLQQLTQLSLSCPASHLKPIDWAQLPLLAEQTACPLAFWVPFLALDDCLPAQLAPAPDSLVSRAPACARTVAALARGRILSAAKNAESLNPFTRNAIFLSLFRRRRLYYLRELLTGAAAESRRTALRSPGPQSWKYLPAHLFHACKDILRPPR